MPAHRQPHYYVHAHTSSSASTRAMPSRMHHTLNPTHRAKSNHPRWLRICHFRLAGGWGRRSARRSVVIDTFVPPHHHNADEKNPHARGQDPKLGIASVLRFSYPVLPMPAREKISITVSTDLLWAVKAQQKSTGQNRSAVIENCIRGQLTDADSAREPGLVYQAISREEFDALQADVDEIKRVAQQTGAM